jgi:hypothetical protein
MPCRTSGNQDTHLYPAGDSEEALCGRSVSEPTSSPGNRPVCADCAKALLTAIFRRARRISSVEVVAHDEE